MTDTTAFVGNNPPTIETLPLRPRMGSIQAACLYSGLSPATLYEEAGRTEGLFRKYGTKTLVDFDLLTVLLEGLPVAEVKQQPPRIYQQQRKPPKPTHLKKGKRQKHRAVTEPA
jgi:hypothetical protein